MGYHSADYDHDWKIGVAELSRVAELAGTTNGSVVTGCYKVDSQSIDGFAQDTQRLIDEQVTLSKYHSADYNRDGRIDSIELARVTDLYNYRYTIVASSGTVRTGQYHDNNPFSQDGFGLGPVQLSAYNFDEDHKPIISSNVSVGSYYVLRAKMTGYDGQSTQAAVTLNNNGLVLDVLPAPGIYRTELYWIQYDVNGVSILLGGNDIVYITLGEGEEHCRKSQKTGICGPTPPPVENEDKGRCFPYRVKRSCNAPLSPLSPCDERDYYVVSVPDEVPPFYIVSKLYDSSCEVITDESDNPILTIVK